MSWLLRHVLCKPIEGECRAIVHEPSSLENHFGTRSRFSKGGVRGLFDHETQMKGSKESDRCGVYRGQQLKHKCFVFKLFGCPRGIPAIFPGHPGKKLTPTPFMWWKTPLRHLDPRYPDHKACLCFPCSCLSITCNLGWEFVGKASPAVRQGQTTPWDSTAPARFSVCHMAAPDFVLMLSWTSREVSSLSLSDLSWDLQGWGAGSNTPIHTGCAPHGRTHGTAPRLPWMRTKVQRSSHLSLHHLLQATSAYPLPPWISVMLCFLKLAQFW